MQGAETSWCPCQKSVCKEYRTKGVYCRYIHLCIVKCWLKNKFNMHVLCNILFIYLSQHYKPNFHVKNTIWLKSTINYSLFKIDYNWRHCSAISLTVVMLCVRTRTVCVRLPYWSAKQCDWLSHARPVPFPFPLFLFPARCLYSLGEYICLLLIVYLKISFVYM